MLALLTGLLLLLGLQARRRGESFVPNPTLPGLRGLRAWGLMLATGLLMGLLHHSPWPWDPSSLARALGLALASRTPPPAATALTLLLPLGMLIVQRRRGRFHSRRPVAGDLQLLLWGTVMGLGTVWGMGANDGYLFRSLPLGSLHAAWGLTAMTAGILLPVDIGAALRQSRRALFAG